MTQVITDSPAVTNLLVTQSELNLGKSIVLTAPFFDGQEPILGADVKVLIMSNMTAPIELTLVDDGVYSAVFKPEIVGDYRVSAQINGYRLNGTPCFREAGTQFTVLEPTSHLTGNISDEGIDTNGNGLFDKITINVETDTIVAGEYRAFVYLETATGQKIFRTSSATLATGIGEIAVDFEIEALLELGENGPYNIKAVELIYYGKESAIESDHLKNIGQTQAYLIDQFEKPWISFTGIISSQGIDQDGDDLFEQLKVSIEVDVLNTGSYNWTLNLADPDEREITFASGSDYFYKGINNIVVNFDGLDIGNYGMDGPYFLQDLLLSTNSNSLIEYTVGKTKEFLAIQFPVDRTEVASASCKLYAVHDEGLNNSQFFTVDLNNYQINNLGPMYEGYDIESLAVHPQTNIIYASSGKDVVRQPKGHIYIVDGQTGKLFPVGSTGFKEVDSLAFSDDGTLWGWAKGNGLITINTDDMIPRGKGNLEFHSKIEVEDLALSKKPGILFYGAVKTDLWMYPPLELTCQNKLPKETEALEMMPNDILLFGTHQDATLSLHAFDVESCSVIGDADIKTSFNDIEGLALPVDACAK